jgi:N-acetylglucosaminyl-diphospho-decaprenol L-rhamnosyltransferase
MARVFLSMVLQEGQTPLLDIIIVTAPGTREFVRDCLASIRKHPLGAGPAAVYVTDNSSQDGSAEMVRDEFPEVKLVTFPRNAGFCIANNYWLARSDAPFSLLLNPDTELTDGALDYMLEVIQHRPDVGIAGCRLVQRDGTFDHAAKRSFPTRLSALAHFTGIGRRPMADPRLAQYRAPELSEWEAGEVDAVNGAFMLVRHGAMEEVGLLDEGYGTYMEDLDWCYRFKEQGWKVWYDGGATVVHVKGGATVETGRRGRYRNLQNNLSFHRSMARFYRKFYAGRNRFMDLVVYLGIVGKLLIAVARSTIARRGFG